MRQNLWEETQREQNSRIHFPHGPLTNARTKTRPDPTECFAILEPGSPQIGCSELHKILGSTEFGSVRNQLLVHHLLPPTDRFTILEPQNPSTDLFNRVQKRRSTFF